MIPRAHCSKDGETKTRNPKDYDPSLEKPSTPKPQHHGRPRQNAGRPMQAPTMCKRDTNLISETQHMMKSYLNLWNTCAKADPPGPRFIANQVNMMVHRCPLDPTRPPRLGGSAQDALSYEAAAETCSRPGRGVPQRQVSEHRHEALPKQVTAPLEPTSGSTCSHDSHAKVYV